MPLSEHVVNDYQTIRLSLKAHPMRFLREHYARQKFVTADQLKTIRDGKRLSIAGLVLIRQRPGSAKGVVFITIEDETGVANLVVWPDVFDKQRKIVMGARLMAVHGIVQRDEDSDVIHVVAARLEDHSYMLRHLSEDIITPPLERGDAPKSCARRPAAIRAMSRSSPKAATFINGHLPARHAAKARMRMHPRHHRPSGADRRATGAASADRRPMEEPDRKRDHSHRALRKRPLRQSGLGIGAGAARSFNEHVQRGRNRRAHRSQANARPMDWNFFIPDDNIHVCGQAATARQPPAQAHRLRRCGPALPLADLDPRRWAVAQLRLSLCHSCGRKLSAPFPPQTKAKGSAMKRFFLTLAALLVALAPASANARSNLEGRWKNGKMEIVIAPCGRALCGTVVKASAEQQARAQSGSGTHLIGARVIDGIQPAGGGTYRANVFVAGPRQQRKRHDRAGWAQPPERARLRARGDLQDDALGPGQPVSTGLRPGTISPASTAD